MKMRVKSKATLAKEIKADCLYEVAVRDYVANMCRFRTVVGWQIQNDPRIVHVFGHVENCCDLDKIN